MQHSFDVEIAIQYGINQAIILNNLFFWIQKNKANGKHFYDGHYWTYNSKKAFSELLPYMTERQIDYSLTKLVKDGLIIKGNYNKSPYDRTLWYALTDKAKDLFNVPRDSILQNCEMNQPNSQDVTTEIVRPIPDINTYKNTYNVSKKESSGTEGENKERKISFNDIIEEYTQNEQLRSELKEHLKTRKAKKAPFTNRALILSLNKLDTLANTDEEKIIIVQNSIMNGWSSFFKLNNDHPQYLNNKKCNSFHQEPASYNIDEYESLSIFDD
nr:MAG TPA: Transcriptional regulator PadR-like family [Bacteriophage sp.]